jgi:predicted transcriptional regulator
MRFSRGSEGQAFLHSLASMDVPWCKSRTDGRKGDHIETVSFHGTRGKTIYLRAYDKGVESKTLPPGERIRVERQRRYRKEREQTVAQLASADLHSIYLGKEFASLVNLPTATVCDVPEALQVLWERAGDWQQFERLAGYIVAGHAIDYPRATSYRRPAELRSLGIYVDPAQIERVEVPVGRYLHALSSAWAA